MVGFIMDVRTRVPGQLPVAVPVETGVHATRGVSVRADLWLREFSKFRDVVCVASMVS